MEERTDSPETTDSPAPDYTPRPNRIVSEAATVERCREDYLTAQAQHR